MELEPVYADDGGRVLWLSKPPPDPFRSLPKNSSLWGCGITAVEQAPWTYRLKTTGKVAVDEIYCIVLI